MRPRNLSQTDRIQTFSDTADALVGLREPEVPAALAEIQVKYNTMSRRPSRATRHSTALDIINVCIEALAVIEESDARHDEARALRDELESASAEAEQCEFPGMYQ